MLWQSPGSLRPLAEVIHGLAHPLQAPLHRIARPPVPFESSPVAGYSLSLSLDRDHDREER